MKGRNILSIRRFRCCLGVLGGLWLFLCAVPVTHASASHICKRWYQQKRYANASRCYLRVYKQLKKKEKRSDEEKEQMGAALRNVGLILRKSAEVEKEMARAAYLREQAVRYLTLFLKGKHYHSETQRSYTITQRDSLKEKVGYAKLSIFSHPQSQLHISGYKFSIKAKGSWSGLVRPGRFAIIARYKGQTEAKEATIPPNQPKVVRVAFRSTSVLVPRRKVIAPRQRTMPRKGVPKPRKRLSARKRPMPRRRATPGKRTPPRRLVARTKPPKLPQPSPRRSRLVPGLILGVGLAAVAAGGILTGVAFLTKGSRDAQVEQILKKQLDQRSYEDTRTAQSLHGEANTQLMAGIITGSIGLAAIGVGVLLFAL